ncbi:MAG: phage tail protein [Massilia sp.]
MDPYLGEIKLMSFNFAPRGWAQCNGQLLPINQNQALFSLLGTTYGGDGRVNFALPNLRGQTMVHMGNELTLGQKGGSSAHTLSLGETGAHSHGLTMSNALATSASPVGAVIGKKGRLGRDLYAAPSNIVATNDLSTTSVGGNQAHNNMQPYTVLCACIALQGIFPSQN